MSVPKEGILYKSCFYGKLSKKRKKEFGTVTCVSIGVKGLNSSKRLLQASVNSNNEAYAIRAFRKKFNIPNSINL